MRKPKVLPMSDELRSMLANSASQRKQSKSPKSGVHGYRELKLEKRANKWLARSGYFTKVKPEGFDESVHHDAVSTHGHLRPTWQGRV